jgi:hypothetical protein
MANPRYAKSSERGIPRLRGALALPICLGAMSSKDFVGFRRGRFAEKGSLQRSPLGYEQTVGASRRATTEKLEWSARRCDPRGLSHKACGSS